MYIYFYIIECKLECKMTGLCFLKLRLNYVVSRTYTLLEIWTAIFCRSSQPWLIFSSDFRSVILGLWQFNVQRTWCNRSNWFVGRAVIVYYYVFQLGIPMQRATHVHTKGGVGNRDNGGMSLSGMGFGWFQGPWFQRWKWFPECGFGS